MTLPLVFFDEAHEVFRHAIGAEARLGEALMLLMRQPKTQSNVNEAARLLDELASAPAPAAAPGAGDDGISTVALYYLARLEQTHRLPPNPGRAKELFQRLVDEHPAHALAQQAAVKLAILELYDPTDAESRADCLQRHARRAATLTHRDALRDLHLALADATLRFKLDPAIALEHLLAADAAGILRPTLLASIWVRIGELARETGRVDISITYYQKYLEKFIRDNRRLMVQERLAALESTAPPSSLAAIPVLIPAAAPAPAASSERSIP